MYYVKMDDGVNIAVQDLYPQGKHTVFFIHGWPLGHRIFEYQYNVLPSQGIRCLSIDLRGFGQSDGPAGPYTYDRLAKDVYTVIRQTGVHSLVLSGFSMGGAIALRYMTLTKGFRVAKLALLGAAAPSFTQRPDFPYGMTPQEVNALIAHIQKDRAKAVADFGKQLFATPPSAELAQWFTDICWQASSVGTIQTAISLRDEDMRGDLRSVHVPTGIFHGKKDLICPYDFAPLLHEGIGGSVIYPYENSGHAFFYEEMELFNKQFVEFVTG